MVRILLLLGIAVSLQAQDIFKNAEGVAIDGYDPVAYFVDGRAIKGSPEHSVEHAGAVWHFTSADHKTLFVKSPSKYLPQYNGWCAWAVAEKNAKFPVDPKTFKISDGKLYLFYNGPFGDGKFNALEPWNKEEKRLTRLAETNWKTLKDTRKQ
jgi:YHS domain-containing protein